MADAGKAPVSIAVAGAGLIGRRHVEAVLAAGNGTRLAAIVDPAEAGKDLAARYAVRWYPSLEALISEDEPDGVILATPNQAHVDGGMECVAAGVPALIEKPFSVDTASGQALIAAAERAGVPLLTGHHRRHNPLIRRAREEIRAGAIGDVVSVHATTWLYKPDDYFAVDWRRRKGAGPVFINLIHDIDLLHFLCGQVVAVHAFESGAVRGNEVEDTAVVTLRFAGGALGTVNVSDTVVAPWSWELTARENPAYPATGEACYLIGGTHGALELPALKLWKNREKRSWWKPIGADQLIYGFEDPLVLQVRQFAAVIRGQEAPLCSGRDGLDALRVIEAIKRSAETGRTAGIGGPSAEESCPK